MPPVAVASISIVLTASSSILLAMVARRSAGGADGTSGAGGVGGALVFDVWGPIVLVLPFLGMCGRIGDRLDESAAIIFTGPTVLALIGIAAACMLGHPGRLHRPGRSLACWGATGIAMVMLAAANELTILVGQTCFAIAAVILWLSTSHSPAPQSAASDSRDSHDTHDDGHALGGAGWLLIVALLSALGNAIVIWNGDDAMMAITAGGAIVGGMWVMLTAAKWCAADGIRLAGWTATLGVLLALGVLALRDLLPEVIAVARMARPEPVASDVIYGLGRIAPEAVILAVLPGLAFITLRLAGGRRFALGLLVLAVAAGLAIVRLLGMGG